PRTQPNPACQGEDLNPKIAAAVDADAALTAQLDTLLGGAFPEIALESKAMPPVGAGDDWISVSSFFARGAAEKLAAIDSADDDARVEIDAAVEAGDEAAVLAMKERAAEIAASTAKARADFATPVLAAANQILAKDGAVAWCANPNLLGGCTGTDVTATRGAALLDEAKVEKALAR
ncbi:MAG: hypothetical protein H0V89_14960, partial [Deltaproteobacteria bacterium]|nr:hypothetical protein [Deltaproteobacteria bacterium]